MNDFWHHFGSYNVFLAIDICQTIPVQHCGPGSHILYKYTKRLRTCEHINNVHLEYGRLQII